ncbi:alpha-1,2-fucosyltransferase [Candidatus Saccharibacteria bacterium]|nr:alpha-1,2-fucosyltransferase [Candidatus Saccharibacteria bacterium]
MKGKNFIGKYMRGRLGNQLFQYAAMRQVQEINGNKDKLYINFSRYVYSLGFENGLKDFKIKPYLEVNRIEISVLQGISIFFDKIIKRVYRQLNPKKYKKFRYDFENRRAAKMQKRGIYWKEDGALKLSPTGAKNKILIGHFESSKNFDTIRDCLLKEIQPINPPLVKNKNMYDSILNTESVCVSIRRGDFVNNVKFSKNFNVCGVDYFENAIKLMKKYVKNPVFVIFSDDIEWCKKNIPVNTDRVIFEDGDDPVWEKLRLMYSCKHFIISNSTFSWWAQYLSRNNKKIVIAPKVWSKFGYNGDLYDRSWILLDNCSKQCSDEKANWKEVNK